MNDNTVKGRRVPGTGRAPKVATEARTCAHKGCTTALSRYNRRDHCFAHAPTRFPRLRGRVIPEA